MIPDRSGRCGGSPCGIGPIETLSARAAGTGRCRTHDMCRYAKSLEVGALSAADPLNIAGTVTAGTTVPRGGRVSTSTPSRRGRDPRERGPRPHHLVGCPRGPAPSRRRGQPVLGGRRGTTTPVRPAALQRVGAFPPVPAGRRTLDRHMRISRRGTGHHPQDSPLSAPTTTRPAPSNRPAPGPSSASSPPRRPAKQYPSCEPAPDLLSLTKLVCKRFHKGGAGRSGAPGNRGCLIPQLRFPWNQAPSPRHKAMSP